MLCEDCGYMMSAFDASCPRCSQYPPKKQAPVQAPDPVQLSPSPTGNSIPPPPQVNTPSFPHTVSVVTPSSNLAPQAPVVHAPYNFCCPYCASPQIQKVSAVCQSGTWTADTSALTVTGTHIFGGGNAASVGATAATTSGASELAKMLAPPLRPVEESTKHFGASLVFFLLSLLSLSGSTALSVFFISLAGLIAWLGVEENKKFKNIFAKHMAHWHNAMQIWDRCFYCSRCHHVHDSANGRLSPAHQIQNLLW